MDAPGQPLIAIGNDAINMGNRRLTNILNPRPHDEGRQDAATRDFVEKHLQHNSLPRFGWYAGRQPIFGVEMRSPPENDDVANVEFVRKHAGGMQTEDGKWDAGDRPITNLKMNDRPSATDAVNVDYISKMRPQPSNDIEYLKKHCMFRQNENWSWSAQFRQI